MRKLEAFLDLYCEGCRWARGGRRGPHALLEPNDGPQVSAGFAWDAFAASAADCERHARRRGPDRLAALGGLADNLARSAATS